MVIIILLLILTANIGLSAEPDARTYQIQPTVPVQPPTGYVMVPEERVKEMLTPKEPQVNLKELANAALATKNDALSARSSVSSALTSLKKASQSLTEAEAVSKAAQQLITDRKKAKDEQTTKLIASIEKARAASKKSKDSAKKVRDNKKAAKNLSDANDADRAASITEEIATSVDTTVSHALTEITKDDPTFKP